MPAVAIVVDVIASDLIGTSIVTAVTDVVGSALVGDIVSGAVIGAIGGATSAVVQGGNIWKGATTGAEFGGIAGGVSGLLQGAEITGTSQTGGPINVGQTLGVSPEVAKALSIGAGATAGGLGTGQGLTRSLELGALQGGLSYLFPATGTDQQKMTAGLEKGFLSTALSPLLASPPSSVSGRGPGTAVTGQVSQFSPTPGSQALAQALNVGDAGAPVLGGGADDKGRRKNVWNVESLRYMGSSPETSSG